MNLLEKLTSLAEKTVEIKDTYIFYHSNIEDIYLMQSLLDQNDIEYYSNKSIFGFYYIQVNKENLNEKN